MGAKDRRFKSGLPDQSKMRYQVYILTYDKNPYWVNSAEGHTFVRGKKSLEHETEFRLALGCRNLRYYKIDKGVAIKKSFY